MPNLPYVKHSATSKAAAERVVNPGTKRAAVLQFITSRGFLGATDDEIQVGLGMGPSTERPRRIELFKARLIARLILSTRLTRTGCQADIYVAATCLEPGDRVEFAPVEKDCCPACGRPF